MRKSCLLNQLEAKDKFAVMRVVSKIILLISAALFCSSSTGLPANTNLTNAAQIISLGKDTAQKIRTGKAEWTVTCRGPGQSAVEIHVIRNGSHQRWIFSEIADGTSSTFCRILQTDGVWYVQEKDHFARTRPYQAELHFDAAYVFLSLSQLQFLKDESQLAAATFQERNGSRLSYRLPLPEETRRILENVVSQYEQMGSRDPGFLKQPDAAKTLNEARAQLTNSVPLSIDEKTGVMVEMKIRQLTVSVSKFHWLDAEPIQAFEIPKGQKWDEQSQPWPESDYENCILVGHDPLFTAGGNAKLNADCYILNLRTDEIRRIPYEGAVCMGGCFLEGRHEVFASGVNVVEGAGLLKINLLTGQNVALGGGATGGLSLDGDLSPDGKQVATMHMLGGESLTDLQIQLIDLATGKLQILGQPGQIGAPFSWLPDGKGLVLKRFKHTEDSNAVEPRILCRLDLDGHLTDLRPGDMPLVLRKSRKILYQDNDTDLWHTCDLDGSRPELYADGLAGYDMPAISPDEKRIVFVRFEKGKLPQLMLFDFDKSTGRKIGHADGYTAMPVWR
jgi:hypothetical protein